MMYRFYCQVFYIQSRNFYFKNTTIKDILINETKRLEHVEVFSKKWLIDANYWARTLLRGIHSELEPFYLSDDHKERAFCV